MNKILMYELHQMNNADCKVDREGVAYKGKISHTRDGSKCIPWTHIGCNNISHTPVDSNHYYIHVHHVHRKKRSFDFLMFPMKAWLKHLTIVVIQTSLMRAHGVTVIIVRYKDVLFLYVGFQTKTTRDM